MSTSSLKELKKKLEKYKNDLSMVEGLLKSDPGNSEFQSLQRDLQQYVTLTEDLVKSKEEMEDSAKAHAQANTEMRFAVGAEVSARWHDGKWYDVRVEAVESDAIVGSAKYLVTYKSYGTQETIPEDWIRTREEGNGTDANGGAGAGTMSSSSAAGETQSKPKPKSQPSGKRERVGTGDGKGKGKDEGGGDAMSERLEKKKRITEAIRERDQELKAAKSSWQSFRTKGSKKKKGWAKHESMFKAPDAPTGRVGVIGSGQKMTQFADRRKILDIPLSASASATSIPLPQDIE